MLSPEIPFITLLDAFTLCNFKISPTQLIHDPKRYICVWCYSLFLSCCLCSYGSLYPFLLPFEALSTGCADFAQLHYPVSASCTIWKPRAHSSARPKPCWPLWCFFLTIKAWHGKTALRLIQVCSSAHNNQKATCLYPHPGLAVTVLTKCYWEADPRVCYGN